LINVLCSCITIYTV